MTKRRCVFSVQMKPEEFHLVTFATYISTDDYLSFSPPCTWKVPEQKELGWYDIVAERPSPKKLHSASVLQGLESNRSNKSTGTGQSRESTPWVSQQATNQLSQVLEMNEAHLLMGEATKFKKGWKHNIGLQLLSHTLPKLPHFCKTKRDLPFPKKSHYNERMRHIFIRNWGPSDVLKLMIALIIQAHF